jgi:hypothetical protein
MEILVIVAITFAVTMMFVASAGYILKKENIHLQISIGDIESKSVCQENTVIKQEHTKNKK